MTILKLNLRVVFCLGICFFAPATLWGQYASNIVVPGTGTHVTQVGDDFEDESWSFVFNNPKSTEDIDENQRQPLGQSTNKRWYEGAKRGHPDIVQRVPTPPGGLEGSAGSLLLKSLYTGIPSRPSRKMHQDDFICNVQYRIGGTVPVAQSPNMTTRVYLPPMEQWEKRNGPHFAFGGDFMGPEIPTMGWWTLGISFTPDGLVHYFAKPGVDELTRDDYIATAMPYGYKAEEVRSFFYNVVNGDNGKDWSTDWIIDDPKFYIIKNERMAKRN